jgi:hypothetical protein
LDLPLNVTINPTTAAPHAKPLVNNPMASTDLAFWENLKKPRIPIKKITNPNKDTGLPRMSFSSIGFR